MKYFKRMVVDGGLYRRRTFDERHGNALAFLGLLIIIGLLIIAAV